MMNRLHMCVLALAICAALVICAPTLAEQADDAPLTAYVSATPRGSGSMATLYVTCGAYGAGGQCDMVITKKLDGAFIGATAFTTQPDEQGMVTFTGSMSVPDTAGDAHVYSLDFVVTDDAGHSVCGMVAGMWTTDSYTGTAAHRSFELVSAVSAGTDPLAGHTRHTPAFDAGDVTFATGDVSGFRPAVTCLLCQCEIAPAAAVNADCCVCLPPSVQHIEREALMSVSHVEQVWIDDGALSIGDGAFAGCANLMLARIPASVTQIGSGAFDGAVGVIVLCPEGSAAWQYCENNGIARVKE